MSLWKEDREQGHIQVYLISWGGQWILCGNFKRQIPRQEITWNYFVLIRKAELWMTILNTQIQFLVDNTEYLNTDVRQILPLMEANGTGFFCNC